MDNAGKIVFELFTNAPSIHCNFYKLKKKLTVKKLISQFSIHSEFFHRASSFLVQCKTKGSVGAVWALLRNWQ